MMEKEYAMQALAGLSEPWSNAACMGYCLMAMRQAGVPEPMQRKVLACHGTCKKYKAWAAAVKAEKAYTKDMVSRDRVNRSDYVKEGWMAHKGQRRRKK